MAVLPHWNKIACHANKFLIERIEPTNNIEKTDKETKRMNPREFRQFTHVPIPNILPS